MGVVDADGFLTITDRLKDIIIRGGENISAAEVEQAIATLPQVAEVVVVAAPDERLGERVRGRAARAGASPELHEITATSRTSVSRARSGPRSCASSTTSPHRIGQGTESGSARASAHAVGRKRSARTPGVTAPR